MMPTQHSMMDHTADGSLSPAPRMVINRISITLAILGALTTWIITDTCLLQRPQSDDSCQTNEDANREYDYKSNLVLLRPDDTPKHLYREDVDDEVGHDVDACMGVEDHCLVDAFAIYRFIPGKFNRVALKHDSEDDSY